MVYTWGLEITKHTPAYPRTHLYGLRTAFVLHGSNDLMAPSCIRDLGAEKVFTVRKTSAVRIKWFMLPRQLYVARWAQHSLESRSCFFFCSDPTYTISSTVLEIRTMNAYFWHLFLTCGGGNDTGHPYPHPSSLLQNIHLWIFSYNIVCFYFMLYATFHIYSHYINK